MLTSLDNGRRSPPKLLRAIRRSAARAEVAAQSRGKNSNVAPVQRA